MDRFSLVNMLLALVLSLTLLGSASVQRDSHGSICNQRGRHPRLSKGIPYSRGKTLSLLMTMCIKHNMTLISSLIRAPDTES